MNTLRGSRTSGADNQSRGMRVPRPLLVSIAVHVAVVFALVNFIIWPAALSRMFERTRSPEIPAERISFLRLPKAEGPPVSGRSGGDGRAVSPAAPPKLVAPPTVPTTVPPATPATTRSEPEEGSGPLVGSGGPARGVRPTYTGPRVWVAPGDIVSAPKSAKEKLDSAIVSILAPVNDSIVAANARRSPRDWTFERGGRKWGLDSQYIRLGKLSIPTAVLALLPMNQLANPTVSDRNRFQDRLHADIFWQAQRGMNEADFKKAVKSIRERKEREKAAAEKKARQADQPAAPPPP